MENIAPIQIAEPKREKRAAVTAAYRRGYADALEDMRKRQREKKRRRQYFIIQKLNGIALLAFTALAVYILEGDSYNSNFNSAVSVVYDFQPGNVHSE